MANKRTKANPDRLHSVASAAEFLGGVGQSTIRGWFLTGKIRRVKVGRSTRVWQSDLEALIGSDSRRETEILCSK